MPLPRIRLNALASGRSRAARRIAFLLLSGLTLSIVPAVTVLAQDVPRSGQSASDPHAAHIAEAAQRFGIPEHWIRAVLRVESAGNVHAISSAGAMGLMQVMPDTWAKLRARYRLGDDPYLPRDNILAGTAYLREMLDRYGNVGAMLAAYNAGPGRYDEYLASGRVLPSETRLCRQACAACRWRSADRRCRCRRRAAVRLARGIALCRAVRSQRSRRSSTIQRASRWHSGSSFRA